MGNAAPNADDDLVFTAATGTTTGVTNDGRILARKVELRYDAGAYADEVRQAHRDAAALRDEFVRANLRLVVTMARRYDPTGGDASIAIFATQQRVSFRFVPDRIHVELPEG